MKVPWLAFLAFGVVVILSGCSQLSVDYGESRGVGGRTSLNGFGTLRSAYEQAGVRSRDVNRLSNRVRSTDVIVWTPKTASPIGPKTTQWFDRWLRQGGRTLVYVIPDGGSEAEYWLRAAKLAPPDQRLEYRKRAAQAINQRMQWRLNRSVYGSNGWFQLEPLQQRQVADSLEGPWQADVQIPLPGQASRETTAQSAVKSDQSDSESMAVEYKIDAYRPSQQTTTGNKPMPAKGKATGPGAGGWFTSIVAEPSRTPVQYRPLLSLDPSVALVGEVRSPQWNDSKILVVAAGSLLTNYAFSHESNRRLADKIILESIPQSKGNPVASQAVVAGFLTTNAGMVPISDRAPGAPRATGMEMLTEWPISVVTMHGLVVGMVVCLMLLPIFGRPKKIRRVEANDFGHHLDAVAALMKKVGGESYARGRISEYMKRMHGETGGPWVLPDPTTDAGVASLPKAGEKPLTSSDSSTTFEADKNRPVQASEDGKPAEEASAIERSPARPRSASNSDAVEPNQEPSIVRAPSEENR